MPYFSIENLPFRNVHFFSITQLHNYYIKMVPCTVALRGILVEHVFHLNLPDNGIFLQMILHRNMMVDKKHVYK